MAYPLEGRRDRYRQEIEIPAAEAGEAPSISFEDWNRQQTEKEIEERSKEKSKVW
jgi:hypothetical protein